MTENIKLMKEYGDYFGDDDDYLYVEENTGLL
jgi:hypothetical protein